MTRLLAAALLLAVVTVSAAHLRVDKASPAEGATITVAPGEIRIWFTEAPALVVSSLKVTGPSGNVDLGKLALGKTADAPDHSVLADVKTTLASGKYVVSWKTSGKDGHILTGTYEFTLKTP
jgi:methionine-rich copper-binding protein CopC